MGGDGGGRSRFVEIIQITVSLHGLLGFSITSISTRRECWLAGTTARRLLVVLPPCSLNRQYQRGASQTVAR